jgi:pilus assembly protein TadC
MVDLIFSLLNRETLITILLGLGAFATFLTVAAPFMQNDELKARMKLVSAERDRLKSRQRAQTAGTESKLRDNKSAGLARQVVDTLGRLLERTPGGRGVVTGEDLAALLPRSRVDAVRRDLVAWDIDLFESVRDASGV